MSGHCTRDSLGESLAVEHPTHEREQGGLLLQLQSPQSTGIPPGLGTAELGLAQDIGTA